VILYDGRGAYYALGRKRWPPGKKTRAQRFGTSVIERMIRQQLKGQMHLDWRTDGLACEIVLQTSKL
jgi:two-component sensor histidine kinase